MGARRAGAAGPPHAPPCQQTGRAGRGEGAGHHGGAPGGGGRTAALPTDGESREGEGAGHHGGGRTAALPADGEQG